MEKSEIKIQAYLLAKSVDVALAWHYASKQKGITFLRQVQKVLNELMMISENSVLFL